MNYSDFGGKDELDREASGRAAATLQDMSLPKTTELLRLTDRGAVYGLVLVNGVVVRAAPMGRWLMGRTEQQVRDLCKPRRIRVGVVA